MPKTELQAIFRIRCEEYASTLAIAPDGTLGVVGLGDGRIVGFNPSSGHLVFTEQAHAGSVLGVAFTCGGRQFVTCGQDAVAKIWNSNGTPMRELPGTGGWVEQLACSPDSKKIATASAKVARVWSSAGELLVDAKPLESTITGLAWNNDGTELAACCYGGVHILPVVNPGSTRHLPWKGSLISLTWSPDGKVIACGSQDRSVHFWRLASGKDSQMSGYAFKPRALAWDRDSTMLATAGDASVTIWDFKQGPEGSMPIELHGHQTLVTQLSFHPQQGLLASGSQESSIMLWMPRKATKPIRFAFMDDEITGLQWHPESPVLFGIDSSGTITAWEYAS